MRNSLLLLISLMLMSGCNSDKPSDLISEETYIDLMVELRLLQSYQEFEQAETKTIDSLRMVVFEKYDVTEKQFEESHRYYRDHDIKAQRDRIGKAVEQLRKDRLAGQDSVAARDSTSTP